MNKYEQLQQMSVIDIAKAIIKISASSNWKCRLCYSKDKCDKDCLTGIGAYLLEDEKGSVNK